MAMGFELLIGLVLGILAATFRNTWLDTGLMATTFVGISAPTFLTGLLFLNWWAFRLGWFPVGGSGLGFWDDVYHTILPAFTLAIFGASTYARLMRSELIEKLHTDYVRTARAKGLGPVRVVLAHGVRNALLPVVTLMGLQLQTLVSGAIITETIFAYPGIGRLAWEALNNWDDTMILGVTSLSCAGVLLGNMLADIGVASLDPRIRLARELGKGSESDQAPLNGYHWNIGLAEESLRNGCLPARGTRHPRSLLYHDQVPAHALAGLENLL
jgi:peptide/nickel transport system permease protein